MILRGRRGSIWNEYASVFKRMKMLKKKKKKKKRIVIRCKELIIPFHNSFHIA